MFSDYECIWRTIHLHSQRELQDSIWRPLFRHVQFSIGPYATALLHTTSHDDVSMHAADFCSDRRNPMWKTWFQYIPIQQFNTFCIHFVHLIRIPSYSFLVQSTPHSPGLRWTIRKFLPNHMQLVNESPTILSREFRRICWREHGNRKARLLRQGFQSGILFKASLGHVGKFKL